MDSLVYSYSGGASALCGSDHTAYADACWFDAGSPLLPQLDDDGSTSPDSFLEASVPSVSPAETCLDLGNNFSEIPNAVVDFVMDYTESKYVSNPFAVYNAAFQSPAIGQVAVCATSLSENSSEKIVTKRSDSQVQRRRLTNREASFRYRQKLKQRTGQLQEELHAAFEAYQRARNAYERAEHAFEVTEKLICGLIKRHN